MKGMLVSFKTHCVSSGTTPKYEFGKMLYMQLLRFAASNFQLMVSFTAHQYAIYHI